MLGGELKSVLNEGQAALPELLSQAQKQVPLDKKVESLFKKETKQCHRIFYNNISKQSYNFWINHHKLL